MPKQFKFQQQPEYFFGGTQVILSYEDFDRLSRFAEKWLNWANSEKLLDQETPKTTSAKQSGNMVSSKPQYPNILTELDTVSQKVPRQPVSKDVMSYVSTISKIMRSNVGYNLGKFPLDFLSHRLSWFKRATQIFSTRDYSSFAVAKQFHKSCDHVPNVLVIIKSGQYIAGGYTEVPFESVEEEIMEKPEPEGYLDCSGEWRVNKSDGGWDKLSDCDKLCGNLKSNSKLTTFVFSANLQKIYHLRNEYEALDCSSCMGPSFGKRGLHVADNYAADQNHEKLAHPQSSFSGAKGAKGPKGSKDTPVLFGSTYFSIDEHEVFQLE